MKRSHQAQILGQGICCWAELLVKACGGVNVPDGHPLETPAIKNAKQGLTSLLRIMEGLVEGRDTSQICEETLRAFPIPGPRTEAEA